MPAQHPMTWRRIVAVTRLLGLPGLRHSTRESGAPCLLAYGGLLTWWDLRQRAPGFRVTMNDRAFWIAAEPETFFITKEIEKDELIFAEPERVPLAWVMSNLSFSWRSLAPIEARIVLDGEGAAPPQFVKPKV